MGRPWYLSVRQVAVRLGYEQREMREELKQLHEKKGGLLFRRGGASNTKLWVDERRLRELWPHLARQPTERDLASMHNRIDRCEVLAERALRKAQRLERDRA